MNPFHLWLFYALQMLLVCQAAAANLDRYGGMLAIQREATGHFRVEQVNGRWMFITPEGHGYLALGANHVGKYMAGQHAALLKRLAGNETNATAALAQPGPGANCGACPRVADVGEAAFDPRAPQPPEAFALGPPHPPSRQTATPDAASAGPSPSPCASLRSLTRTRLVR